MKAFSPQGTRVGATIGAKADTDRYRSGCAKAMVSAPWPPIEWPVSPDRPSSTGKCASINAGSSSAT